jgi:hypothetical protein
MLLSLFYTSVIAVVWANSPVPAKFSTCVSDQECIEAPAGTCDCGALGKNISVRRDMKDGWLKTINDSSHGGCLAAVSKDWSCWHFKNKCDKRTCTLQPIPISEFSNSKESECDSALPDTVNRNACLLAVARRERRLPLCLKMNGPETDQLKGGNPSECLEMIINEIPIKLLKKSLCQNLEWHENMCLHFISQRLRIPIEKLE